MEAGKFLYGAHNIYIWSSPFIIWGFTSVCSCRWVWFVNLSLSFTLLWWIQRSENQNSKWLIQRSTYRTFYFSIFIVFRLWVCPVGRNHSSEENRHGLQCPHFNDQITVIISIRLIHAPNTNATTLERRYNEQRSSCWNLGWVEREWRWIWSGNKSGGKIQDGLANGDKENEIIEAAKNLRGKILMPKAEKEFDKNSSGMRICRIGNRNVAEIYGWNICWRRCGRRRRFSSKTRMNTPGQWIRQSVS